MIFRFIFARCLLAFHLDYGNRAHCHRYQSISQRNRNTRHKELREILALHNYGECFVIVTSRLKLELNEESRSRVRHRLQREAERKIGIRKQPHAVRANCS